MTTRFAVRPLATAALFVLVSSCVGDGCSCMSPIPGGFPPEERVPNAAQVRVSQTGLAAIASDPAGLVGGFLDGGEEGIFEFDVPPQCAEDDNPRICCEAVDMPTPECGPIIIDLDEYPGDPPRMEIDPIQGASQVDLLIRARVYTAVPLRIRYDTGWFAVNCDATVDTRMSGEPDLLLRAQIQLPQDGVAGTTRIEPGDISVEQLDDDDISLSGGVDCTVASWFKGSFIDTLAGFVEDTIYDMITEQVCKSCPSGEVGECGAFADACTDQVCMKDDGQCLQELGLSGRLRAAGLLGSFSPGTLGAIDLYEVAGGYASTNSGGIALGVLGGALPGGAERDRCGPSADPPAPVSVPISSFFQGNTRPDTGAPFDFGFGLHQHNLDLLAWSAYEGGFLCLNVGTRTIDLLTSDTLAILMPSLVDLLHGRNAQLVLGLRPQNPPAIQLGLNTTTEVDGETVIDDPMLDVTFDDLDIDFYAMVDDQYIRVMTLRADVHLPINLDVTAEGEIQPVLGDLEEAFTNLEVFNSEALDESPEQLADKFPAVLSLALPLIADGLGSFALPELGPLQLQIAPDGITSVEDRAFLAIFGDIIPPGEMAAPAPVETRAELVSMEVPHEAAFRAARWDRSQRPRLTFELGGVHPEGRHAELEWSFRVDGGLWSPYTRSTRVTLDRPVFWLQGRHSIEVRAREVGRPETADPTPEMFRPIIDRTAPQVVLTRPDAGTVFVTASDNVSKDRLRMRYRVAGGPWGEAPVPGAIELGGHPAEALEVHVLDEAGNEAAIGGDGSARPIVGFHGTAEGDGCDCSSAGGPGAGGIALVLMTMLGLARGARRRVLAAARRVVPATLAWVAIAGLASLLPACNCGGASGPMCENDMCLEGEVERGPTGRYNSIAASPDRVVVAAYDEGLGDLVVIEVGDGDELTYQAVDGVPDVAPTYEPDTYRGGVVQPGPDVGAWTSIALHEGQARLVYQNVDEGSLSYAAESGGDWRVHTIDEGADGEVGHYASLALDSNGVPAVVYLAPLLDDGADGKSARLLFARASGPEPSGSGDWTVEVIDEVPVTCAGACASGLSCAAVDGGERCVADTGDCNDSCGSDQVCLDGTCQAGVPNPPAHDLAHGAGLFANLAYLSDGQAVIVYYDRDLTDLVMQVGEPGSWTRVDLDAGADTDTGMWASIAIGDDDTVHVAYQDALGDQLLYTTWSGGQVGPVEVVDDGTRSGDRPHPVGAAARVILDGSGVAIAYQDGATSDLVLARPNGESWDRSDLLSGPNLYGFFIDAATASGRTYVTTYMYDRAYYPPGELVIATIP